MLKELKEASHSCDVDSGGIVRQEGKSLWVQGFRDPVQELAVTTSRHGRHAQSVCVDHPGHNVETGLKGTSPKH